MDLSALHKEYQFRTSRSSGSGGQHVNKVATKVELIFHLDHSEVLDMDQKYLIAQRLKHRITKEGTINVVCQESRSQLKNKNLAIKKFEELLLAALRPVKKRKKVKPLTADKNKRLDYKKKKSKKKALRKKIILE